MGDKEIKTEKEREREIKIAIISKNVSQFYQLYWKTYLKKPL